MQNPSSLPEIIHRQLRSLQRRLCVYVALDGAATTLIGTVLLLGIDLVLDRFFEFSRPFRAAALLGMFGLLGYLVWLRIGRRLVEKIRDDQLAMVFERFVPELDESLVTAIELDQYRQESKKSRKEVDIDPLLFRQTVDRAARQLEGVDARQFFRYGRLAARSTAALLVVGLVGLFCIIFHETAEIGFSRNILLSDRDWPRRSELIVEGFDENGRIRIGRGDSFTLRVRAKTRMPLVPETVRLRFGVRSGGDGGNNGRTLLLDQFRLETVDGTDWRVFSHTFAEMLETVPIFVRGADSSIDGLLIEVVPRPILTEIALRQKFPEYMQRSDRTITPTGRTMVPDGTSVTITAASNKELTRIEASVNRGEPFLLQKIENADVSGRLEFELSEIREDTLLEFMIEDTDRLKNRQPIRLDFSVIKDQPPVVTARLEGIGSAVTPQAVLPTSGEVTDDNGIASARFRYVIDRKIDSPKTGDDDESDTEKEENHNENAVVSEAAMEGAVEIPGVGASQTVFTLSRDFSLPELELRPEDKLSLHVEARDRFNLDESSGLVGVGSRWSFEIVSPERLKSLLEVREISLRQRFEVLIGEVERTRTLIDDIMLEPPQELIREAEALVVENGSLSDAEESDTEEARQKELEEKKRKLLNTVSKEQTSVAQYNISRSLRDTQKEAYDLRTIIESFRLIRQEMVNNRIFSEDDRHRLDDGVIVPMQRLVEADFPDLDRQIEALNKTLDIRAEAIRPTALGQRADVLEQFDVIVKKMLAIRDNMISMESFNEVIEILRAIIKQQEQLRNETQEQKNTRLRNLLD